MPELNYRRKTSFVVALLSLAMAIILLGYSSYGWMTMSKSVTAIGQNIKLSAPSGLYISLTGNDDDWHETIDVPLKNLVENNYNYDKTKDSFYIMPASSYNGTDGTIWQTNTSLVTLRNSADIASVAIGAGHEVTWNPSTSANEGHYVDVPLYFKAIGAEDIYIGLDSKSSIANVGGDSNVNKIVRVAFLNADKTAPSYVDESLSEPEPLVYALPGAKDSDRTKEVLTRNADNQWELVEPKYISADLSNKLLFLTGVDYSATTSVTYKSFMYARIWIEGQDPLCVASIGSKTFSVSLTFQEAI